jgi:hypothetical protein
MAWHLRPNNALSSLRYGTVRLLSVKEYGVVELQLYPFLTVELYGVNGRLNISATLPLR